MFVLLVFVTATVFLITRAGEYNDELMLVDQMIGDVCVADESHEGRNALALFETTMLWLEPRG